MINSFHKLNELLKNDEIRFTGLKTNNTLHDYSFFHIFEEFDFDNHQQIFQRFIESPVIIINQLIENNNNQHDNYFIISFKKTILIINQSQVSLLHPLFSKNSKAKFCFISECQNIFIQNYQNQIHQIQCDEIFIEEEVLNFKRRIYSIKPLSGLISKVIFNAIMTSIAGYLIKQSYSKSKEKLDSYFQTNKKPE